MKDEHKRIQTLLQPVKESDMGFRACELNSGENQFSPVTSL